MKTCNRDVIDCFIRNKIAYGSNLYSTGDKLYSYNTCIAQWSQDTLIINKTKYSVTTSKHQFYLKRYNLHSVEFIDGVIRGSTSLI